MEPISMKKCCQNDQVFVDLLNACEKHKNAALAVKEIAENQKKKLKEYRELNSKLFSENYELEQDIKEKDDFIDRVKKKRNDLEAKVPSTLEKRVSKLEKGREKEEVQWHTKWDFEEKAWRRIAKKRNGPKAEVGKEPSKATPKTTKHSAQVI